jgi:hypothetical protein
MLLGAVALVAGALAARRAIGEVPQRSELPQRVANAARAPRPSR